MLLHSGIHLNKFAREDDKKHNDFTGFISSEEVKILLQNANVFIHHSITPENGDEEGIPTSVMEAIAM